MVGGPINGTIKTVDTRFESYHYSTFPEWKQREPKEPVLKYNLEIIIHQYRLWTLPPRWFGIHESIRDQEATDILLRSGCLNDTPLTPGQNDERH